jgi:hypothetical protein
MCLVLIEPQAMAIATAVNGYFIEGNFIHTVVALGTLQIV